MQSIKFGKNEQFLLKDPLDTWLLQGNKRRAVHNAVGSSARVFKMVTDRYEDQRIRKAAFKVMRHNKIDYASPLFKREVQVMALINDLPVPGITRLLEMGFLKYSPAQKLPEEIPPFNGSRALATAENLRGNADMFSVDEADSFLTSYDGRVEMGWLPFLVFEQRGEENMYMRCDAGFNLGKINETFPIRHALKAVTQILDVLVEAHKLGIAYLDHKILHYYWRDWEEDRQQVFIIDWNIGYGPKENLGDDEKNIDLVQFAATTMHYMFAGRLADGAKQAGPSSPDDIFNAPKKYEVKWTYDDQRRMNGAERKFLQTALKGEYTSAEKMREDVMNLIDLRNH